ncbi:MAG: DNA mismatch repair endonuclease MutL [Chloroflexi bacterium]|nr:DNA mismatch repair endonuclease MutL [Chloroflexota bacterium]
MSIKVLDKEIISRIAAGEVVERPASVVKELVENALDAGATQISVEVRGGGVNLIRVVDNGSGIASAEVELAFERHATSKVSSLRDLDSISTLGFRGEALPSIAAVAQVEVSTCATNETAGTFLSLANGKVAEKKSQGRSPGTTITTHNLFRDIPARLKFLKSFATESSHIANVVSQYALAFPEVRFTLLGDGRVALRTPGSGELIDSIIGVYGVEVARNMLPVDGEGYPGSSIKVNGMVGTPNVSRSGRDGLSFFVNRRWVNSRLLTRAVEEAYSGLLQVGKHPVAVVNIALPPGEVDVNIHPTKLEVKFRNEHAIFAAVQRAVRQSLVAQMPVPRIESPPPVYTPNAPRPVLWSGAEFSHHPSPASPLVEFPTLTLPVLRVLGQFLNSYIVAEGSDGLYLIDQHAAHERVLFEKIDRQLADRSPAKQGIEVQGLLEPATLELSPREAAVLESVTGDLSDYGFTIEPFGDRTYLVRTVPGLLHEKDWRTVLRELLNGEVGTDKDKWREKIAISIACHSAVRAGQMLSDDEMRELIRQLERAASPRTCPHGRPTMLHLSLGQLEREFGRG